LNSTEQYVLWNLSLSPKVLASLIASAGQTTIRVAPALSASFSQIIPY